jgi:hypothetical protein
VTAVEGDSNIKPKLGSKFDESSIDYKDDPEVGEDEDEAARELPSL